MTEDTKTTGVSAGFDTSGTVRRPGFARPLAWSDLSPFEQGYVEALLRSYSDTLTEGLGEPLMVGFSDLDPEALAMSLRDCEAMEADWPLQAQPADLGATYWREQQRGALATKGFPPLTVYLGDDGRVQIRAAIAKAGQPS